MGLTVRDDTGTVYPIQQPGQIIIHSQFLDETGANLVHVDESRFRLKPKSRLSWENVSFCHSALEMSNLESLS